MVAEEECFQGRIVVFFPFVRVCQEENRRIPDRPIREPQGL